MVHHTTRSRCDCDHSWSAQNSFTGHSGRCILSQPEAAVQESGVRVLVVEDYVPWSEFICSMLEQKQELRVVSVASNGIEAVEKAKQLKPDLILLDIGLPQLDGIEVARRIGAVAMQSKILFVSENRDPDIIQEALSTGALGYVVKSQATMDLPLAIDFVLAGGIFVSDHGSF